MIIIQRPDYPLYSLSLTAAIYKCISNYDYEFLTDNSILENIKVIYFVKKYWNFNSSEFLEKIKQSKLYNCESIFFILIQILDFSILMISIIIIPYIITFIFYKATYIYIML